MKRGALAEAYAAGYLSARGLRLLERNFRCRLGEIDLIMRTAAPACVVFVEVRYRRSNDYGSALASVTPVKQQRLARAAATYLAQHQRLSELPARFDVVGLEGPLWRPHIEWVAGAFEV